MTLIIWHTKPLKCLFTFQTTSLTLGVDYISRHQLRVDFHKAKQFLQKLKMSKSAFLCILCFKSIHRQPYMVAGTKHQET